MFLRQDVTTLFPEKVGAGTLGHPVEWGQAPKPPGFVVLARHYAIRQAEPVLNKWHNQLWLGYLWLGWGIKVTRANVNVNKWSNNTEDLLN